MNKEFEKILDGIESLKSNKGFGGTIQTMYADGMLDKAKEIVQEVAEEYNGGWIACSERLPEDNGVYFVTLDDDIMPRCIDVRNFRNGVFEQRFIVSPLQGKCPEEKVVAWMPLPEPYKEND